MGIWRTFVSRPAEVERSELYYGGPVYIAGYTPTGEDTMYAFLVEKAEDRFGISDEDATRIMLEESRAYGGPWNSIRADLEAGAHANYTWFTQHIVDGAVEPRPRRRSSGMPRTAALRRSRRARLRALEDALVLTELLVARDALDDDALGRVPRPPPAARDRRSSRHPCSSASGRSTATAMPTPAG